MNFQKIDEADDSWFSECFNNWPALSKSIYVIAEIGTNHGGEIDTALAYIEACAHAGANAVKFQSWNTGELQAKHDKSGNVSESYQILRKFQIPEVWYDRLIDHCKKFKVDFLSTPFDIGSARLLRDNAVPAIKIASGDLTYTQLLEEVSAYGLPILLSTGMSTLDEIESALKILQAKKARTILLHCVGAYPPDLQDANLRAIQVLSKKFPVPIGFSDHYPGVALALGAVALGACVVEKHVVFSREAGFPDSPFAMEMDEFSSLVSQIRILEEGLGSGHKECMPSEESGRIGGRRSHYWCEDLLTGTVVQVHHLATLRPAKGDFSPSMTEIIVGRKIARPVYASMPVMKSDLISVG